jgi:solute carrier family 25 carnitine/acylcarnitine transporter 20/29
MPFSRSQDLGTLPSFGHGIAGILAGTTVSFIAAPVEHIKARLQVQYAADKSKRMYSGPIDCLRKLVSLTIKPHNQPLQPPTKTI